ncbi:serine protease 33 [Dromaius novaehollandiae]|uniref:serine protease 33 n=1 Tax=Dromaius novaehollandiae TaxID=8790 RepID=UPI00311DAB8D
MAAAVMAAPGLFLALLLLFGAPGRGCDDDTRGTLAVQAELTPSEWACGRPRPPGLPRNVGGEDAGPGEWPWQGSLLRRGTHVCGASLIAPQWVLTAAHCFQASREPGDYAVLLGVRELAGPRGAGAAVPLGLLLPHPAYAGEATSGDIALGRLARPVAFSAAVLPVCLPGAALRFAPGTRCVATGWGDIKEGEDLPSPRRLQKLEVPLMAQATCRRLYGIDMGQGLPPRRIQDDMMCAGYPEGLKDTCKGDSGGPLVCRAGGRWVLAGIVSWGEGCAVPNRPGVYTRVSAYSAWLARHVPGLPFVTAAAACPAACAACAAACAALPLLLALAGP